MKTFTQEEANLMDKELDIVHQCLTDLYEQKYDSEHERIKRIKEAVAEIDQLTNQEATTSAK